ncbi:fasciclin domain-containing protein [Carboxylicivirga caseinilyticus]|uniref:fasciclin domain-containing protein n=1 Tax=Carboxylicivirga caseinilyticus TaxID=3417572 RepID=UPI003D337BD4|nr:fasciclin domain-containing protein [Marinilabiliaceae bacterium A049]
MKIRSILSFIFTLLIVWSCKNEKDSYYDRPEWLEPAIYQQLQDKGNFNSFLACVDKAGLKSTLSGAGFYTVFAPTDEAFKTFLEEQSLSSISAIDEDLAKDIVSYAMIQNRYSLAELDDYQSVSQELIEPDIAFKRKTTYYKWTYEEDVPEYGVNKVIDVNAVSAKEYTGSNIFYDDNNFKNIPYFTPTFLGSLGLTSYDYNYFYPSVELGEMNVVDAKVTEADLYAENGVIHIVDKVILPLPNIEEKLAENDNYSTFKTILDEYIREYDIASDYFLIRNEQVTGTYEDIFVKGYPSAYFSPNVENYLRYGGGEWYDDQTEGFTMFAPNNAAIEAFFNEKFLKYYESIEQMTTDQIADFINAHLWKNNMWPSKFARYNNLHGEDARFDPESNIEDKALCSNGIFYGTNIVQGSDLYYTVFGDVSLNPEYSNMLNAINTFPIIKTLLKNSSEDINIQLILLTNDQMDATGITYDYGRSEWTITDNNPLGNNALVALERLLNLHLFLNKDVNFEVPGIYKSGMFENGEYVKVAYYRRRFFITSSGNASSYAGPQYLGPIEENATNGQSYSVAEPVLFTTDNVGVQIEKNVANFGLYYQYLYKSATSLNPDNGESMEGYLYNTLTKAISDVKISQNNTILIPNDAAIQQAVADGYLPPITIADFTLAEQQMVYSFVKYHILSGFILEPSSYYHNAVSTQFKTVDGETYVTVVSGDDVMTITDSEARTATVVNTRSNVLANRAIIHQIDTYLRYPKN